MNGFCLSMLSSMISLRTPPKLLLRYNTIVLTLIVPSPIIDLIIILSVMIMKIDIFQSTGYFPLFLKSLPSKSPFCSWFLLCGKGSLLWCVEMSSDFRLSLAVNDLFPALWSQSIVRYSVCAAARTPL